MVQLALSAPAKLNLFLHVLGKRADGYHALESLVVFTELADRLTVEAAEDLSLHVEGEFADAAGDAADNLVLKAARALQEKLPEKRGAKLVLTKEIPVGAGLGGGSADAAAALRGLNRLWEMGLNSKELRAVGATLGADVPMCLDSMPAMARGTGTELSPVLAHWPKFSLLLVHPRVSVLSKAVYGALELREGAVPISSFTFSDKASLVSALNATRNDLQHAAISVNAAVAEVLLALETLQPAPMLTRMTGSGACCFAMYADAATAEKAAENLRRHYPDWWVRVTGLKRD